MRGNFIRFVHVWNLIDLSLLLSRDPRALALCFFIETHVRASCMCPCPQLSLVSSVCVILYLLCASVFCYMLLCLLRASLLDVCFFVCYVLSCLLHASLLVTCTPFRFVLLSVWCAASFVTCLSNEHILLCLFFCFSIDSVLLFWFCSCAIVLCISVCHVLLYCGWYGHYFLTPLPTFQPSNLGSVPVYWDTRRGNSHMSNCSGVETLILQQCAVSLL